MSLAELDFSIPRLGAPRYPSPMQAVPLVHAGMSGRTNVVVGNWRDQFTHVPIALAIERRKKIDLDGWLWNAVLASTGQPALLR